MAGMFVYYQIMQRRAIRNLEIDVVGVKLEGIGLSGVTLDLTLLLYNPGGIKAVLDRMELDVYVNDVYLGHASVPRRVDIPPGRSRTASVEVNVPYADAVKAAISALRSGRVNVRVEGTAYVKVLGITIGVPVSLSRLLFTSGEEYGEGGGVMTETTSRRASEQRSGGSVMTETTSRKASEQRPKGALRIEKIELTSSMLSVYVRNTGAVDVTIDSMFVTLPSGRVISWAGSIRLPPGQLSRPISVTITPPLKPGQSVTVKVTTREGAVAEASATVPP